MQAIFEEVFIIESLKWFEIKNLICKSKNFFLKKKTLCKVFLNYFYSTFYPIYATRIVGKNVFQYFNLYALVCVYVHSLSKKNDTKIGFQILGVKHYFSKKLTKDLEPNNHAGFGAFLFSVSHKKIKKSGAD